MGVLELINHLVNFVLPALGLALFLPLSVRWTRQGRGAAVGMSVQMLVLAGVNVAVLLAGLLVFGRDGTMVTYMAMAVASASIQWLLLRAWRN